MSEPPKGFSGRFFDKVAKERGISKSRIYKILALQRLCDEVKKLGDEGKIRETALLEISKVETPARQKLLADLVIARNLTVDQVRELAKLVRAAEKAPPDQASDLWDQFFELKDAIESKGMTESISKKVHQVAVAVEVPDKPAEEPDAEMDPELRKALGFPELVECTTGRGLDVGTTNIVSGGRTLEGEIHFVLQRNAFLDVRNDSFTKRMLIKLGIDHVMHENRMYVIGDPAFELANIFEKETRRPMKDGLISPLENESLQMISMIIHQVLGNPREPGELVYYCVPADPIDADRNVIYHRGALETILRRQGFTPKSIIEGHSVVMSELESDDFTGIGVSCGGGMFNVCIAYKSVPALTFSTSRGGDWVDINVGKALGIPASQATAIKEGGVDLTHPRNRQEEAICIYYRELIHYTLATMQRQLESVRDLPAFSHPVELVCAGGTSLIKGFIQVFDEEYQKVLFPIEVKRIRLARDPLRSVATGCLAAAQEEMAVRTGVRKEPDAPTLHGGGRVASVSGEIVTKSKDTRTIPKRKGKESEDENVKILPALKKLPRAEDAPAGGPAPVEQKIVSLPKAKEPPAQQRKPEAHIVSLPKAKEPPPATQGPERKILPPMAGLVAASGGAAARPAGKVVSLPDIPEAGLEAPKPAPAEAQVLPPVHEIAAEEPAPLQAEAQVVQLPAEGLDAQPVEAVPLEGVPAEALPDEQLPVEGVSEDAVTEAMPAVTDEVPAEQPPVNLEYPAEAIEQALAAAAALGITGGESAIVEPMPAEGQPVEEVPAAEPPAEQALEAPPLDAADASGGVELAPFIQQAATEGEPPAEESAPAMTPEEHLQADGEPTQWVGAEESAAPPEEAQPPVPPEAPPELILTEEPPPLPPGGPPKDKPKR